MEKNYVRYAAPSKARFAALLDQARGTRTMKRFAEECGVNPSTFSRIYNQANKGASSEELIRLIAEHAAPESGVTLDMLMEANGFIPEGSLFAARQLQEMLEDETKKALLSSLEETVEAELIANPERYRIGKSMSIMPDIVVNGVTLNGEKGQWLIDVMTSTSGLAASSSAYDDRRFNFNLARRVQERIGRYLSAYCMVPDDVKINRISLAIYDEQIYELILDHYGNMKTNDSISFILVDLDKQRVEEEYVLEDRNGKKGESLFRKNYISDTDKYEEDFDGLFWDDDSEE